MLFLQGHTRSVQALAYAPDGATLLSAGDDGTIRQWDLRAARERAVVGHHADSILALAVSPDGTRVAAGGHDKQVRLWDIDDQRCLKSFSKFPRSVNAVAFSPDGRYLTFGAERHESEQTLRFIDLDTFGEVASTRTHQPAGIWSLAFGPSDAFAIGWSNGLVEVTDGALSRRLHALPHAAAVTALAFTPDESTLVTLSSNTVLLWDLSGTTRQRLLGTHGGRINAVAFTPDGRHLGTAGWDGTVRWWDVESAQERGRFDWGLGSRINALAISPDGMTAAAGGAPSTDIVVWDVDDL